MNYKQFLKCLLSSYITFYIHTNEAFAIASSWWTNGRCFLIIMLGGPRSVCVVSGYSKFSTVFLNDSATNTI